ncbi:MAG: 30S ribosomal protein S8 [Thermoguttaceae bacterium]|nr:30S ribosomal protein S8 [Thermoguttaceae bacterium]
MMTDPIADMLTRIRNSVRVEKQFVDLPFSNMKKNIAEVMKREGYIRDYQIVEAQPVNIIRIQLKYGPNGEKVIRHIQRVSKPGCRVYSSAADLKPVLNGLGVSVVSTSKGLLSDREAKSQQVGGEIICEIW